MEGAGIKDDKIVFAKEHWNVCQVIHCVETESKFANFLSFGFFGTSIQFSNVSKILITKLRVVVNPQSRTLTFSHPFVNQTGLCIFIVSLIVEKFNFSSTGIVRVLNELFKYGKSICVFFQKSAKSVC